MEFSQLYRDSNSNVTRVKREPTVWDIGPTRRRKRRRVRSSMYASDIAVLSTPRAAGYLGIETKFVDQSADAAVVTTLAGAENDPATLNLSAIAQGVGESQRDGRKCTIVRLHVKGDLHAVATTTLSTTNIVRILIVQDTQTNGAQLKSEDVLTAVTHAYHAFPNLKFSKRFKICKDHTFMMRPTIAAGESSSKGTGPFTSRFDWTFKMNMPVIHSGTGDGIANVTDNSLHLIAIGSDSGAVLSYESRIRFVG